MLFIKNGSICALQHDEREEWVEKLNKVSDELKDISDKVAGDKKGVNGVRVYKFNIENIAAVVAMQVLKECAGHGKNGIGICQGGIKELNQPESGYSIDGEIKIREIKGSNNSKIINA